MSGECKRESESVGQSVPLGNAGTVCRVPVWHFYGYADAYYEDTVGRQVSITGIRVDGINSRVLGMTQHEREH